MNFLLGRNPSTEEIPKLKMSNYRGVLPTPPASCDYSKAATRTLRNVYLNDQYGDCVIAGAAHIRGVTSGNAGDEIEFADHDILSMYRVIGPLSNNGQHGDLGCDLKTAMDYWTRNGFTDGIKLMGWLAVDPTDPNEYRVACWLFENLYFGIACPNRWLNPMPQGDNFVWDVAGQPNRKNGHCISGVGYDSNGVKVSTWGLLGTLTDRAIENYCQRNAGGEMYVMISSDMIGKAQQKAPNGLNWHELISDFNLLGGNLPVPPDLEPQEINWLI